MDEYVLRMTFGLDLIAVIGSSSIYFVCQMIKPIRDFIFYHLKFNFWRVKFYQRKMERVAVGTFALMIQIDHVRQLIIELEKDKRRFLEEGSVQENLTLLRSKQAMINCIQKQLNMNDARL